MPIKGDLKMNNIHSLNLLKLKSVSNMEKGLFEIIDSIIEYYDLFSEDQIKFLKEYQTTIKKGSKPIFKALRTACY